jgi:hypothetical protein
VQWRVRLGTPLGRVWWAVANAPVGVDEDDGARPRQQSERLERGHLPELVPRPRPARQRDETLGLLLQQPLPPLLCSRPALTARRS